MLGPEEIASRGERLYKEHYQQRYELSHSGQYLAIDVTTLNGTVYLADTPEEALKTAEKSNPQGFFHLVRIGFPAVYRVGYRRGTSRGWRV
jgi:hypothetical protein